MAKTWEECGYVRRPITDLKVGMTVIRPANNANYRVTYVCNFGAGLLVKVEASGWSTTVKGATTFLMREDVR